jgi:hypothetical protein
MLWALFSMACLVIGRRDMFLVCAWLFCLAGVVCSLHTLAAYYTSGWRARQNYQRLLRTQQDKVDIVYYDKQQWLAAKLAERKTPDATS